ncbi:MAG TPA: efflux RND transporter periplasmic adaptor subunit [Candidatus Angelobacter sp.]|jgi:HlyD family secretion protein|nr:efflux RND transporter periplasmic adaptor subunit [Candidatus Angelobacter sp.]
MNSKKKIFLIIVIVVLLVAVVGFSLNQTQKNVVAVQTAKVARQDIASTVTASGEIKPKTFVNVGANAFGRITKLFVQEGDRVKKGQMLAQLENVQPAADVAAMRATLQSNETDSVAAEANLNTEMAQLNSSKADAARIKLEYDRAESLYKNQLIAKSDYDAKKAAYEVSTALIAQNQARIAQARAQLDSARGHIGQARAQVTRASDALGKTSYPAPFDGVVTYLPVREGESVVVGIQNSQGSLLMTIADMSVITAEVRVDETDIVNVKIGQPAEVTIDALPGKTFHGKISQIGDNAIVRSSGLATSQSNTSSQEAKDFKVVVTLTDAPDTLRPGLSSTAKITTGTAKNAIAIPIQALTIRDKQDLEQQNANKGKSASNQETTPANAKKDKEEIQGVFVVGSNKKAEFRKVETGLTGTTDIEVKSGLQPGDEIITGSYKVLRTLRNGAGVKVDNSVASKEESS